MPMPSSEQPIYGLFSRLYRSLLWIIGISCFFAIIGIGVSLYDLWILKSIDSLDAPLVTLQNTHTGEIKRRPWKNIESDLLSSDYRIPNVEYVPISNSLVSLSRAFARLSASWNSEVKESDLPPEIPIENLDVPYEVLSDYHAKGFRLVEPRLKSLTDLDRNGLNEHNALKASLLFFDLFEYSSFEVYRAKLIRLLITFAGILVASAFAILLKKWVVWIWFGPASSSPTYPETP